VEMIGEAIFARITHLKFIEKIGKLSDCSMLILLFAPWP